MNSLDRQSRITDLIARFRHEIEIAKELNYTDSNRDAQNIVTALFRIVFRLPSLRNLDLERQNYPSIDLADDTKRVAFQITADNSAAKITETLEKFRNHKLYTRYDRLIIYILTEKKQYRTDFSKSAVPLFKFDNKADILDFTDILPIVMALPTDDQEHILELLEENFSDDALRNSKWQEQRLPAHQAVFVPPAEYEQALTILRRYGIVFLVGPAHIGKSETAFELLLQASAERQFGTIIHMPEIRDWSLLLSLRGKAILLDDPLGKSNFDNTSFADRSDDLFKRAKHNLLVITSRQDILDKARVSHRIGQTSMLGSLRVDLKQEGSYNNAALHTILEKHILHALQTDEMDSPSLSATQASVLSQHSNYIVGHLRFPHNIERLVNFQARKLPDVDIETIVNEAKDIELVVSQWYAKQGDKQQDLPMQLLAAIVTLFPHNTATDIKNFYVVACSEMNIPANDVQRLIRQSSGYIEMNSVIDFAHPSYAEGILAYLQTDGSEFAWKVLYWRAKYAVKFHLKALIQCRVTSRLLGQDDWLNENIPQLHNLTIEEYFSDFVNTYNFIIEQNFSAFRASFLPKWDGKARIHVDNREDGEIGCWAILQDRPDTELVTFSADQCRETEENARKMDIEARDNTRYEYVRWHAGFDTSSSIPQIAALDSILSQMTSAITKIEPSGSEFLAESWHLRMARLLVQLKAATFPMESFNIENPLTNERLREILIPFGEALRQNQNTSQEVLRELAEWPPAMHFQELYVPDVVRDIKILQEEGHPVTGQFLLPPDLDASTIVVKSGGTSFSDLYTDSQLLQAVETGLRLVYEAYKATVELSFPTLYKQMWLYNALPLEYTCVIDRDSPHASARPRISYGVSPLSGNDPDSIVEVQAYLISENSSSAERGKALAVRENIQSDKNTNYFTWGNIQVTRFIQLDGWREEVHALIANDLKRLFDENNWSGPTLNGIDQVRHPLKPMR